MGQKNLTPLINSTNNLLGNWIKLKLSWMGRVAAFKMMIFAKVFIYFSECVD